MFTLQQVVSREDQAFLCSAARLDVGQDGRVYLLDSRSNSKVTINYVLGVGPDAAGRRGVAWVQGGEAPVSVAVNSRHYMARAEAHFGGEVTVIGPDLDPDDPVGVWAGAWYGDDTGYDAPFRVIAGAATGRFYALAQYGLGRPGDPRFPRDPVPAIVAVGSPPEQVAALATYKLQFGAATVQVRDFRLRETAAGPEFYVLYKDLAPGGTKHIARFDQTGAEVWDRTDDVIAAIEPGPDNKAGGFDVAASGHLYVIGAKGALYRYPTDNGAAARTQLQLTGAFPTDAPYKDLRVLGSQLILQRQQDREMFGVFTLPDPATAGTAVPFVRSVWSQYELVQAVFTDQPQDQHMVAGSSVPVTLTVDRFDGGVQQRLPAPGWRAWLRTVGAQDHREVAVTQTADSQYTLAIPADAAGMYQLTLAPTRGPWRIGETPDYRFRRIVEIRPADATGSVSLSTVSNAVFGFDALPSRYRGQQNRTRYAAGEPITFTVSMRPAPTAPATVTLRLDDLATGTTVARSVLSVPAAPPPQTSMTVPTSVTSLLRPGKYLLTAEAPGKTVAAQPIEIGSGMPVSGYRRVWFGDYGEVYPGLYGGTNSTFAVDYGDAADVAAAHLERVRRQGWTIEVDRLARQSGNMDVFELNLLPETTPIQARLDGDPNAVDSMKLWRQTPLLDVVGGLGALGVQQRGLLLANDTILPAPEQKDVRQKDARTANFEGYPIDRYQDLFRANTVLSGYRAFGGWHWAANWWLSEHSSSALPNGLFGPFTGPYPYQLDQTKKDHKWRPLLAAMQEHALSHGPDLQRQLRRVLAAGARAGAGRSDLVTAAPGPFRAGFVYPPDWFTEVDEVDLQAQWEQFPLWLHTAFAVDYYPRPGKQSTLHEESGNDSGAGEQLLGQAFAALMRGSNTSGHSGPVVASRQLDLLPDPRGLAHGLPSMHRVLAGALHDYGEWVSRFGNADRVAILISRRTFAVEGWFNDLPDHVGRIFEAYVSLLYAQIPTSLVFVEDLDKPGVRPLSDYDAVLLVHELVEFDADVQVALQQAKQVFHDGTCAADVVAAVRSKPLGYSFNQSDDYSFQQAHNDSQNQSANPNRNRLDEGKPDPARPPKSWQRISMSGGAAVRPLLEGTIAARSTVDDKQVLVSERMLGSARLVIAVNNSLFDVDNALFRRADVSTGVRAPLSTTVRLAGVPAGSAVYDVFAGKQVTPSAQRTVTADFRHWPAAIFAVLPKPITGVRVDAVPVVNVRGDSRTEIDWSVAVVGPDTPLPVRIRALDESNTVLWQRNTITPASGAFYAPANTQGRIRVEAVELVSGRAAVADAGAVGGGVPLDLLNGPTGEVDQIAAARSAAVASSGVVTDWRAAADRLGAHVRDIALTDDGGAVLTAANWDSNLYAVDLATGQQRWQARVGQHFSYGAQRIDHGVAVRASVLDSPSGFGLHLVNPANGAVERRFDLYGTMPRWFERTATTMPDGRPPAFATPADGAWIASQGNLGLAVWRRSDGALLWKQDTWSSAPASIGRPGEASTAVLAALDADTLLVVDQGFATAYQVSTRAVRWRKDLSLLATTIGGRATVIVPSPDGKTVAVASNFDAGRVFLLRTADGTPVATLPVRVDELAWGPDSRTVVVLRDTLLDQYDAATGALRQSYPAADVLHNLDVAADGRIACGDEQGNLVVLGPDLAPLLVRDVVGIPAVRWLPGGDLLVGTWLGQVTRLDGAYQPQWTTLLRSTAADMRSTLLAPSTAPVSAVPVTGNATTPASTAPNLLTTGTTFSFHGWDPNHEQPMDAATLLSATPTPLGVPWLPDGMVEFAASGFPLCWVRIVSPKSVTFSKLSLWDDPAHPESWLRDVRLDVRSNAGDPWRPVARLVSDAASRSFQLAGPVAATELRLVLPPGIPGNLRVAGIAVHA